MDAEQLESLKAFVEASMHYGYCSHVASLIYKSVSSSDCEILRFLI